MENKIFKYNGKHLKIALFSGIALRIIFFIANLIVKGMYCDEVMTALNGLSLADRLTDINGERLPVYFDTWAVGGQSPFATYLTALSEKVLGNNLFAIRLPALIFSILGFIALYFFAKEIFKDDKYRLALVGLGAISPWMIFSGAYLLDCNYLSHILMFALLFIAKAINENKTVYYILSSVCFALCFYCYIASILLIPFILIALYLTLIIKKKISFKNLALSVIAVTVIALPFIVWGLVITDVIQPFTFLGFSFSDMPDYARAEDMAIASGGVFSILQMLLTNLLSAVVLVIINDMSIFAVGPNFFFYGSLLSGIILLFGLIRLLYEAIKRSRELSFSAKVIAAGTLTGAAIYCSIVNEPHLGSLYRYALLSYILVFIEAIGIVDIIKILKRTNFVKALCIYLSLSLIVFTGVFTFKYIPQLKTKTEDLFIQESYGDFFFDCMDFAEENGYEKIVIVKSKTTKLNPAVYSRYYMFGKKEFISTVDEILERNRQYDDNGNVIMATDGSVAYEWFDVKNDTVIPIKDDFYIIETKRLSKADFNENEYSTKNFCYWTVIYKNR